MGANTAKLQEDYLNDDYPDHDYTDDRNSSENCTKYLNDYCEPDEDYILRMERHIYPDNYEWILICAHLVIFVIGLVGNALVCIAVCRNSSMRTVTNYFIFNLSVADFMVILFCLPPTVAWDVTETWFLGNTLCKIVLYFQTVSVAVSVLTLTVISVERWYAICFPLKFKATTSRAKRLIVLIWIISLVIDIPELIVLEARPRNEEMKVDTIYFTQCAPNWSQQWDMAHIIMRSVVLYALPLAFMSFAYYEIVRVLWSSTNIIPAGFRGQDAPLVNGSNHHQTAQLLTSALRGTSQVGSSQGDYQLKSRRKAAKMLVAVVIMFAVCYLPVHIYSFTTLLVALPQEPLIAYIVMISHWLMYANSAVNPLIYNFMSGKFRKEFCRSFGCRNWPPQRTHRLPMIRRRPSREPNFRGRAVSMYSGSYLYPPLRSDYSQTPSTKFEVVA